MSSSLHIDNNKKDILILGKGHSQGLDYTLTAEKLYSINLTKNNTKFCLHLHYNEANSYLFVNDTEIIKFKAKDSQIVAYPLSEAMMTGLNGSVYDFSVDYNAIGVDDILGIHKYLMKTHDIK